MFDPGDPALVANPYPAYARLRSAAPVLYLPELDVWVVSRYVHVTSMLRDPATFSSAIGMSPAFGTGTKPATGVGYRFGGPDVRVLVSMDPPDHLVFRRAVAGVFTPSSVGAVRGRVAKLAEDCVLHLLQQAESGEADFYADVAEPLPVLVLADLFGVPADMHGEFRAWASIMTSDLARGKEEPDQVGRGMAMFRYFATELRKARNDQQQTLLSAIAAAQGQGPTDRELLAFCAFLLVAGLETTTSLLTNLLAAMFEFPSVQAQLRAEPKLINDAVEEGLRYDTPIQVLWRGTTEPVDLGGKRIPAQARVMMLFGSANRDEQQFSQPDKFVLGRADNTHVGFGSGPHYCLGARLARLEVAAALRALLDATSWVEPAGDQVRMDSVVLRGLTGQPIRVSPR